MSHPFIAIRDIAADKLNQKFAAAGPGPGTLVGPVGVDTVVVGALAPGMHWL